MGSVAMYRAAMDFELACEANAAHDYHSERWASEIADVQLLGYEESLIADALAFDVLCESWALAHMKGGE